MWLPLSVPEEGGSPVMEKCPAEGCGHTEDLWLMECAPGHTWVYVNGCGHWGFIYRQEMRRE